MLRSLLAALAGLAVLPAAAGPFQPGGDGGVLARNFALPVLGSPGVLPPGAEETRLSLDVTNEFVQTGLCSEECLVLDGETARLRLVHRRGLTGGWDLTTDIPVIDQDGGFLDGWIQDWHAWFGLPNGGREEVADDRYRMEYRRDGVTRFAKTSGDSGLGDVSVTLGRQLGSGSALRAMAKFATGEGEELSGGNAGGAIWLDMALPVPAGWDGYFAAGWSKNERGDLLPEMQNREIWFGGIGLLAPLVGSSRLHLQVQGHTRFYDGSTLVPLERQAVPMTLGLQFLTPGGGAIDIGFQEDLALNASPDFAVYVAATSGIGLGRTPKVRRQINRDAPL